MYSRKYFIQQTAVAAAGYWLLPNLARLPDAAGKIMTVTGALAPGDMQFTLSHEHVLCDFAGATADSQKRWLADDVFQRALPFLVAVKNKGCTTFIDCTPAYIGRDVQLLKRLSIATGLYIITNTGYYGAAAEKYLPAHVYTENAQTIADRWIAEWTNGIEGTGIRPGFIKTGTDKAPLSAVQQKIIEAAAIAHLATGLTIAVHTGDGEAATAQLRILAAQGAAASARIWVHAQNETDKSYHLAAARAGSWVSFDGVHTGNIPLYIGYLQLMKREGLLNRTLVSQDSGWYTAGETDGGNYKDYNAVFTHLIPEMKRNGFSADEITTLFVTNPAEAFAIRIRKRQ